MIGGFRESTNRIAPASFHCSINNQPSPWSSHTRLDSNSNREVAPCLSPYGSTPTIARTSASEEEMKDLTANFDYIPTKRHAP